MKLPTFQPQQGTSMGSAMTTPARVGPIRQRTPETRPLIATRPVEGELRLGMQKSRRNLAIGGDITRSLALGMRIAEGNETQTSHAAVGKFNAQMAEYQSQLERDKFQIDDATGKKNFEVMPEKMATYEKVLRKQIREEFQFSMRGAEANWLIKTNASSGVFQENAKSLQNKETLNQTVAMAEYALATTYNPDTAAQIIGDLAKDGVINPDLAPAMFEKWETDFAYKSTLKNLPFSSMADAASVASNAANVTGNMKLLSEAKRNKIVSAAQERILNIHSQDLRTIYNRDGSEVALRQFNALMDGGPKASGAIDEKAHNTMMGALNTSLKRQISVDKLLYTEQGSSNFFGIYSNPAATHEDIVTLAIGMDDTKVKNSMDERAIGLANLPPAEFYGSEEVYVLMRNGARAGHMLEPLVTRFETDINNGVLNAIRAVEGIETLAPRSVPLDARSRSRMEFTKNIDGLGMRGDDPFKEQQDFAAIENRGVEQKQRDVELAVSNLKNIETPEEAYMRTAKELGFTDDDYFIPDAVQPGSRAEGTWSDAYTYILPFVGHNHERAARYATTSVSTMFGATTAYDSGEPVTEYESPEAVMPAPGFKKGQPNPYYDEQYTTHIDSHNEATGDSLAVYEVRREYYGKDANGEDAWIYMDLNGAPILNGNGKITLQTYRREDPKKVKESRNNSLNRRAEFFINQQMSVAGDSELSLMELADVDRDPVTGRIADTAIEATNINAGRWKDTTSEGKDFSNRMYSEAFSLLLGRNLSIITDIEAVNQHELETSIHLYLTSVGYMRGDSTGKFIRPPGGY